MREPDAQSCWFTRRDSIAKARVNDEKILVPHDGSKPSEAAVKHAVDLTNSFSDHGEIILLNVVQEIVLPPVMGETPRFRSRITGDEITAATLAKELCQQMKEGSTKMLNEKRQHVLGKTRSNVEAKTRVLVVYVFKKRPSDKKIPVPVLSYTIHIICLTIK